MEDEMFLFISRPDFSCNAHALWKYIEEYTDHKTAWLVNDRKNMEKLRARGICCEMYDTVRGNELAAQAKYIVSNTYLFDVLPKKEGQVFVNLWHGSGVKAHDFYDPNLPLQQLNRLLVFLEKTDLLCVHSLDNRFHISAMLHFDMRKAVVTGQPRLDCVKKANGRENLIKVLGEEIRKYEKLFFYVPTFRADRTSHSGKFYSENVFRLDDYDNEQLQTFLEKHNAALVYKLHPVEQKAFKGVSFSMGKNCYELTDHMLFDADVRYDELLNAFDIMISDYSSIAYDFLTLDRPIIYLIPDYEEYKSQKGFRYRNIDYYMPGEKVYAFSELLSAMETNLQNPDAYACERQQVIMQMFDFSDDRAAERCYQAIKSYKDIKENDREVRSESMLPTSTELLREYFPAEVELIDSTKEVNPDLYRNKKTKVLYLTEEVPDEYRSISKRSSADIKDLSAYYKISELKNVQIGVLSGGVVYDKFDISVHAAKNDRTVIGFAGTIDSRIYFAMVQYLCDAFPDCDVEFWGDIYGEYPAWLDGFGNLKYKGQVSYDQLPEVIQRFDVAILPFYGEYQNRIPNELFQYLACGKQVVASNMPNLPECKAIYRSRSVADAVENTRLALQRLKDPAIVSDAKRVARANDWAVAAERLKNYIF